MFSLALIFIINFLLPEYPLKFLIDLYVFKISTSLQSDIENHKKSYIMHFKM